MLNWRTTGKILAWQNALVVAMAVLLGRRGDPHAFANALFVGGLPFFLYGLWLIVCRLGLFEVADYSFRRLRAVDARVRGDEPDSREPKSFLEHRRETPKSQGRLEYLVIGGAYILISIVFSMGV